MNLNRFLLIGALMLTTLSLSLRQCYAKRSDIILEYIDVVNTGNRNIMEKFTKENFDQNALKRLPIFAVVSYNLSFYYETAGYGFKFLESLPNEEGKCSAIILNRLTQTKAIITIPIVRSVDQKINGLIKIKPVYDSEPLVVLSEIEFIKKTEECLEMMTKDEEFSGSVLIERDGKVLLNIGYGYASRCFSIPNGPDTKFNIASVGKIFTAMAIIDLERKDKISLDDTIGKYLSDDWINPEIGTKLKIKHLLTHTSGLGDYFQQAYSQTSIMHFRDLKDYQSLVKDSKLSFEPGVQFSYSNTGYLLLGAIIEEVSGISFSDYIKQHVLCPAEMYDTEFYDKDYSVKNRATGYTKVYEGAKIRWNNHQTTRILRGSPSGGIYSTTNDLLKLSNYLCALTERSDEFHQFLFSGLNELNASFHSLVFFLNGGPVGLIAEHKGDGQGRNCHFKLYREAGYTVIILSNFSAPSANIVASVIDQLIQGH